jgi:hypothetical protein
MASGHYTFATSFNQNKDTNAKENSCIRFTLTQCK